MRPRYRAVDASWTGMPPEERWGVLDRTLNDPEDVQDGFVEYFQRRREARAFAKLANERGYEAAYDARWRR